MQLDEPTASDAITRLRRIEGQVGGLIRMIQSGRECRDMVQQVSAASHALDQVGFKLLACGLRRCMSDPEAAQRAGYSEQELERLFLKLA